MGEGTSRVNRGSEHTYDGKLALRATAQAIGGEIAMVRYELDNLIAELDRRRHELLNVRLQLRRHAPGATLTTLAVVGTATAGVWLSVWRQRRRQRLEVQTGWVRQALSRPAIPGKIVAAAASAVAAALVKKLLERGVERLLEPVRTEAPMAAGD